MLQITEGTDAQRVSLGTNMLRGLANPWVVETPAHFIATGQSMVQACGIGLALIGHFDGDTDLAVSVFQSMPIRYRFMIGMRSKVLYLSDLMETDYDLLRRVSDHHSFGGHSATQLARALLRSAPALQPRVPVVQRQLVMA